MHGHLFDHGNIARRQTFILPSAPVDSPTLKNKYFAAVRIIFIILGLITSSHSSSSSSSSAVTTDASPSTPPLSSSLNSSSSVSSTTSSLSTYLTPSSTTPTPTPTSSASVLTSISQTSESNTSIIPASASASASSDASTATTFPKPFLQDVPLAGGLTTIGIIGIAIIVVIGTIWIRFSSRRRLNRELDALIASTSYPKNEKVSSLETLRRVNDRSVVSDIIPGQAVIRQGGYPVPPVTLLPPQNYRQIPPHHNQPPVGSNFDNQYPVYSPPIGSYLNNRYSIYSPPIGSDFNNRYSVYSPPVGSDFNNRYSIYSPPVGSDFNNRYSVYSPPAGSGFNNRYSVYPPPRSLDLVYSPSHTSHTPPPSYENIIATTRSTGSHFGNEISPIGPLNWSVPIPQRGLLFNLPPVTPSSGPAENMTSSTRGPSPHLG